MIIPTTTSGSTRTTVPEVRVAIGLLVDALGRVLISQRSSAAHLGGLWEFPGGKCEPGETPEAALHRELAEELGVRVVGATEILLVRHRYPDRDVELRVFRVDAWEGMPFGRERQPLRWCESAALNGLPFPEASRAAVNAARLPGIYLISPGPGARREVAGCVRRVERAIEQHAIRLLQVRAPGLPRTDFLGYARALIDLASGNGAEVLVNAPRDWLDALPQAGWHLSESRLRALTERPHVSGWLAASVHDADGLARATAMGMDFVVAGPVRATWTHPDAEPMGLAAFAELRATAGCPVYALGGMTPSDLPTVWALGAQGIAAIRGLLAESDADAVRAP